MLDTLVDAGVARSRSDALAWCVRLVGDHQGDWIAQLRDALGRVEEVRSTGPKPGSTDRLIALRLVSSGDDGRRVRWHSA